MGATQGFASTTVASFSSGGFSNRWGRPWWSRAAVASYLTDARSLLEPYVAHGRLPASLFSNASAQRAFPDVAAAGEDYAIVRDSQVSYVSGTSCSTPTFAALLALVNDALVSEGKPTLGFINPLLYTYAQSQALFADVTKGHMDACGTTGFHALEGWDAASGWGTPDFPRIKALALRLAK